MYATTASVSSAAFLSVAVTSTRRFWLFVVTSVSFEFMIGGKDIVLPTVSMIAGTISLPSSRFMYIVPVSVF